MGELTGYWSKQPNERYSIKDFVKGTLGALALIATVYAGTSSDSRSMEQKLIDSGGISDLSVIERVIWGANKPVKDTPLDELGSAWYLMHGPS